MRLLALLVLGTLLYGAYLVAIPSLGTNCLNGRIGACGLIALQAMTNNHVETRNLGMECWKGTPATCGILSYMSFDK